MGKKSDENKPVCFSVRTRAGNYRNRFKTLSRIIYTNSFGTIASANGLSVVEGMHKFIFVTGGVLSSLGKGTFTSSFARLL